MSEEDDKRIIFTLKEDDIQFKSIEGKEICNMGYTKSK
jgi:hypothetical protein